MATRLKRRQSPPMPLYQGDDMAQLAELRRVADAAARALDDLPPPAEQTTARVDDDEERVALREVAEAAAKAYDEFLDEIADRAVEVVVSTLGSRRWRDLVLAHPPRTEESEADEDGRTEELIHREDVEYGVNTETFPRALLMYADPEAPDFQTIIEPKFDDEDDRAAFVDDELDEGDVERLWIAAFHLNTAQRALPKAFGQSSTESTT